MNRLLLVLLAPMVLLGTSCGKVEKEAGSPSVHERAESAANGTLEISDAEARKFFDEHAERIRTELRVWQILYKNDTQMALNAFMEIGRGVPFEEVAKKRFPVLPEEAKTPWDLGYLRWSQIPVAWEEAIFKMAEGETSDIIKGPGNRLWIIKLVSKRENPDINFENQKSAIKEYLAAKKMEGIKEKANEEER